MSEQQGIANCGVRRYPHGKARIYFDVAAEHEAIATKAVTDSVYVAIGIDTKGLHGRLLAAGLPHDVIHACIRSLQIDDDSFLTDNVNW